MIQVSASLLAADFAALGEQVRRAQAAGVDSFHFDWMDGHYVPNLALAPEHLPALRRHTDLPFVVHLELGNPDQLLESFGLIAAETIVAQWDTLPDPTATLERIRARGARAGLSLNPDDHLDPLADWLGRIDLLLMLGVQPGFGGQPMRPGTEQRILRARELARAAGVPDLPIAVDGGVKPENAVALRKAGADILIVGTALFAAQDMRAVVLQLKTV